MKGNALATMLLEHKDLPEQRLLWEMNQWGQLATIELQAQQPGPVPEALVLWRWATAWPAPAAGAVVNVAPESIAARRAKSALAVGPTGINRGGARV